MKDRRSGMPNAKIRIRPATRASDREDEESRGIVLAKSLRPSIPFVSNINLTEEFRASGHGSAYRMTQATIPQTNCTGNLTPDPRPYQGGGQPTILFPSSDAFEAFLRTRSPRFTGGWRETLFMSHNDDDIPLFVSSLDIAMGLGDLLKRIALIDDRSKSSRLHELFEENHVLDLHLRNSADDLPASCSQASKTRRQEESADIDASSLQRLHAPRKRKLANRMVNEIVWA